MMKNKRFFEEAELTVIKFGDTDIITTSEKHDIEGGGDMQLPYFPTDSTD